jgi:hypothetical protein
MHGATMAILKRLWLMVALLSTLGLGCASPDPSSCPNRGADDPDGHLLRICRYILEKKIDVSPANPATYNIKRIEPHSDNGQETLWVFLDCCYLGDIAVVDKATGEVLSFQPGAK